MSDPSNYAKLLEPGQIGKVKTRNRLYKSAAGMHTFLDTEFDSMNENSLGFYDALARGGVGILAVEAPTVDFPQGCRWHYRYRMDDDKYIPGMKILVDMIHGHGCPTFLQMEHDGPWQNPLFDNHPATFEGPPIGASARKIDSMADFHRDLIRPLTVPEIEVITQKYIDAAERAQKAGFDGVDLNMGSTHITMNFMSPWWNLRDDEYGGTQKKRNKLAIDIVTGIKKRCGDDFPIVVCVNGFECGYLLNEPNDKVFNHDLALETMGMLVDAGADALMIRSSWLALHVPGFLPDYLFFPDTQIPEDKIPPQYYAKERGKAAMKLMTAEAKKRFNVPVILIGYMTPELGETALEKGEADFIGVNRPLMCDPDMPNKLVAGKAEDIRPCTRCGTCLDQSEGFLRKCRANAALGYGYQNLEKAATKKKVVVVGAGPAGMEAARTAALRGHDVTLLDKNSRLGGLMPLAGLIKGLELEDLPGLIRWFKRQLKETGVKVELGAEATPERIQAMKPDAVVLATGGVLTAPPIEGDTRKVVTTPELHKQVKPWLRLFGTRMLGWATHYYLPVGKKVVVIGAGLHGMEAAEFLIKRGRKVTIVEPSDKIGEGMLDFRLGLTMDWLARKNIKIVTGAQNIKVTKQGITYEDKDGKKHEVSADTVMPTAPILPNEGLFKKLEGKVKELYLIGDGKESGMIVHAIRAGYHTAKAI